MNLDSCFDKHSFNELNNIDIHKFYSAINFFINYYGYNSNYTIFDIGTNAGSFVKALQHFGIDKNIHCFEPHPVISNATKSVYPFINMNNYCIGNFDGNIDIHVPQYSVGLSSIINRPVFSLLEQNIYKLNTSCCKLDTYCEKYDIPYIDFIKIDVEGAEKMVFEGATELLKNKKIKCGLFEVGQTLIDANTNEDEICNFLQSFGYLINRDISNQDFLFYLP